MSRRFIVSVSFNIYFYSVLAWLISMPIFLKGDIADTREKINTPLLQLSNKMCNSGNWHCLENDWENNAAKYCI